MKRWNKAMMMAMAISVASAGTAMAGEWKQEDGNWYYIKDDGTKASNWELVENVWYYFDANTNIMKTGWLTIGANKYYLGTDGGMRTGLFDTIDYNGDPHQYEAYSDGRLMVNTLEDAEEQLTGAAFWHKEDGTILYKTSNTEHLSNMWQELLAGDFQQQQIFEQQDAVRERIEEAMDELTERYYKKVYTARSTKSWLTRLETWEKSVTRKLTEVGASEEEISGYIKDVKAGRFNDDYDEYSYYYVEYDYDDYDYDEDDYDD